jgi:signal transduction histidine kinase
MIVPSGVLGIVLISLEYLPQNINPVLLKLCLLYGNLFASTIDNALLHKHLNQTRELLEQKVAIRTMHLSQSKRELNAIIDSVHNGILVIDAKTNIINRANPVAAQLIKLEESNITGRIYTEFLDSDGRVNLPEENQNFESLLKDTDGRLIRILRTVSYINLGKGKLRIESFLDISDRKKYEEELQESNEILERKVKERTEDLELLVHKLKDEVQEKEKAQGEILKMLEKEKDLSELKTKFVSMVSHEFRTPLTIIRSSAQLMEKFFSALSDDEKKEYLDKIVKTVDFMKDQIENVIFIGKSDTSKIQLSPASINIAEFCRNIINDFQLTLNTKRIIRFNYKGSNRRVLIDTKVLKHVIVNVLSNAVKYSPNDKPVDFSVVLEGNSVIFNIQDYGIGIAEEDQKKIFELFYRGKNVGNISGTGLGMSVIVRSLEILNGKIELSSRVNIGTTFTVIIPVV